jgi:hypothetical protein
VWAALVDLIGFTSSHARQGDAPFLARTRPLFLLREDHILIADLTNALDCLWRQLNLLAKSDDRFHDRFQKSRNDWLEKKTYECFARIFDPKCVYLNLSYPDPDKPHLRATTELDIAVRWGSSLVLVEAKSKQFRLEGQLGHMGKLHGDLKDNVKEAFDQALRARRYIDAAQVARFVEKDTGRVLEVRKQDIHHIYLVTVTLRFLGSVINGLSHLQGLKFFADKEYPWVISRAELEVISNFIETPDIFLHYLERRRQTEGNGLLSMNDQMDLFAAYLRNRLHPKVVSRKKRKDTFIFFTGYDIKFNE